MKVVIHIDSRKLSVVSKDFDFGDYPVDLENIQMVLLNRISQYWERDGSFEEYSKILNFNQQLNKFKCLIMCSCLCHKNYLRNVVVEVCTFGSQTSLSH